MMKERFTDASKKHVFIVGCKGIPTRYGGFETFVDKLTEYKKVKTYSTMWQELLMETIMMKVEGLRVQ